MRRGDRRARPVQARQGGADIRRSGAGTLAFLAAAPLCGARELGVPRVPELPFLSLAMLAADAVFWPVAALLTVERALTGRWRKSR
ncbi:hypothetical protein [Kitasatospora griseola]|uniref:hypothetical protein n=1 Tax=Kitasatospora griseola TaxID=2064 RepID=UPI0038256138